MSVSGIGSGSSRMIQSLLTMRSQLDDLQRQLGTGKRADTYAGLGVDRGLSVGLRSHLSAVSNYGDTITTVNVRLDLAQSSLSRLSDISGEIGGVINGSTSDDGRTTAQIAAMNALGEALGLLNTQAGDRYIFSGLASDQPAVASIEQILDGDGARAGLKQLIAERNQADLGASGLGRLVVSAPTATSVQIAEDAVSPFGFKLAGISTTIPGATLAGPAGAPAVASVDLGAVNPNAGETVRFSFTLPDGSSETLSLTATASATPGPGEFAIGADSTATATNLQTALTSALGTLARTSLSAASALTAADNFFNTDDANPPLRVDGPPFDTATALIAGTPANTVAWYTGDAGSVPVRSTATAKVDQSISVSYGTRAKEDGIRWQLQNIATLAAMTFSPLDADAAARSAELTDRLRPALDGPAGMQKIEDIQADLAGVQNTMAAAADRHQQTTTTLGDFLQSIEGISNEEVAARILALQTTLQASLQTTAMLYQTSILNYL
jgi:flagellin-like hook-associated protein FlgL